DVAGGATRDGHQREAYGAAETLALDQHTLDAPQERIEMPVIRCLAGLAKTGRALLHHLSPHLRHARRRRPLSRAKRKNMQVRQPALLDDTQRILEHGIGLGGKTGNDIRPEHDARAQLSYFFAEA